jgi:hypothetical protein
LAWGPRTLVGAQLVEDGVKGALLLERPARVDEPQLDARRRGDAQHLGRQIALGLQATARAKSRRGSSLHGSSSGGGGGIHTRARTRTVSERRLAASGTLATE